MCEGRTDADGTCTVKDGSITVTKDSVFKNTKIVSLVFDNTEVICVRNDLFCDITIELTNAKEDTSQPLFSLTNRSQIRGRSIFVLMPTGRLIIDSSSALNSDGTSRELTGTDRKNI